MARLGVACPNALWGLLSRFACVVQGLAVYALALVAETDREHGGEETSQSIGWCIIVLMTGYIVAALLMVIMKWSPPTKVCTLLYDVTTMVYPVMPGYARS